MSISSHTYAALKARGAGTLAKANPGKIPHRKVMIDGYVFDSVAESQRYKELRLLEQAGEIYHLEVHPLYELRVHDVVIGTYTADFQYWEQPPRAQEGEWVTEDVKSTYTRKNREYRRNIKLMLALHNITIREIVR